MWYNSNFHVLKVMPLLRLSFSYILVLTLYFVNLVLMYWLDHMESILGELGSVLFLSWLIFGKYTSDQIFLLKNDYVNRIKISLIYLINLFLSPTKQFNIKIYIITFTWYEFHRWKALFGWYEEKILIHTLKIFSTPNYL